MSRLDYYRAVLLGAVIGVVFVTGFYIFTQEDEPKAQSELKSNFEVVDTYRGCSVVRWTQSNFAEYKYFLDCTDEIIMGMPYGSSTIKARKEKYD
jgi:hypothetical protein